MYSYEDRIRAVKLYLKLGKRLTATVRQLAYPTTKSLELWYHTYERCLDLPKERICLRPRVVKKLPYRAHVDMIALHMSRRRVLALIVPFGSNRYTSTLGF